MGNLYTSTTFMEHNSHPDYKYEMDSPTLTHDGINPSCGDELTLQLRVFCGPRLRHQPSLRRHHGRPHHRRNG